MTVGLQFLRLFFSRAPIIFLKQDISRNGALTGESSTHVSLCCQCLNSDYVSLQAFWRSKNQSGQIVSDGGEVTVPGCSLGPLSITYDATSHNGCPALVGFLGGEAAVSWATQTVSNQISCYFLILGWLQWIFCSYCLWSS